jgi:hypothetical protein
VAAVTRDSELWRQGALGRYSVEPLWFESRECKEMSYEAGWE